ncbi:hypothetical protein GGQ99_005126 [Aminobacter niigataensis]|uniref:Uncharacterized protein n=1 Tax=Aminobacter niigataensis TaxID=83265 RepID=A0ABR6L938_9HYPH|nr:hypothetical protein [Aminobacter niigataensis]MBB4653336.1 hypothetical protein [Aminobacter niigataensis]
MTCNLDLSINFRPGIDDIEEEAWSIPTGEKDRLEQVMSAPLMRALDAWNNRIIEGPLPQGTERGDLDDRIEEEIWLLYIHGYSALTSRSDDRRSGCVCAPGVVLPARYAYDVYSLDELGIPQRTRSVRTFPATGGFQPGEFERARDLAEALGGAVIRKQIRWDKEYDVNGFEIHERPEYDRCVFISDKMTPVAAYETFMQQYDDGVVIRKFHAVFEHMRMREHRNVEAITERKQADFQRLGEISFYLGEVRSWKADRDSLLAQGKI